MVMKVKVERRRMSKADKVMKMGWVGLMSC